MTRLACNEELARGTRLTLRFREREGERKRNSVCFEGLNLLKAIFHNLLRPSSAEQVCYFDAKAPRTGPAGVPGPWFPRNVFGDENSPQFFG